MFLVFFGFLVSFFSVSFGFVYVFVSIKPCFLCVVGLSSLQCMIWVMILKDLKDLYWLMKGIMVNSEFVLRSQIARLPCDHSFSRRLMQTRGVKEGWPCFTSVLGKMQVHGCNWCSYDTRQTSMGVPKRTSLVASFVPIPRDLRQTLGHVVPLFVPDGCGVVPLPDIFVGL